jgi:pimeloyl-ACP methyl ester carboxylesterase/DNA-binding CsgD family transcriptional regulator
MKGERQEIRFCTGRDGVCIAYAVSGRGPPLLKTANWLSHLEFDWETSFWRPWLDELSSYRQLVRFDQRGCGLSDRNATDHSIESWVSDAEAVADAAGLDRFALLGMSQGGAVAVAYAARHPERVSHLVLYGAYVRGRRRRAVTPQQLAEYETLVKIAEVGWGSDDPAYRTVFAQQFFPEGTLEEFREFAELSRRSCPPATAVRMLRAFGDLDVEDLVPRVRCPTLVVHATGDRRVPFDEGRDLAKRIPGARFVPLESANHVLSRREPAWPLFAAAVREFLAEPSGAGSTPAADFSSLTPREREILELVAQGLDNAAIAARAGLSEKTVRNHLSNILDKLGVRTRALAIVRAREAGFARSGR